MRFVYVLYSLGVACAAAAGFCSPYRELGFVPLAVGLIWASYDLIDAEAKVAKPPTAPRR